MQYLTGSVADAYTQAARQKYANDPGSTAQDILDYDYSGGWK